MADLPSPLRTAQAIGIVSASLLSGEILSLSQILTPTILLSPPALLLQQFGIAHLHTFFPFSLLTLLSSSSFSFLSYKLYKTLNQPRCEVYALAALITVGVLPFSWLAMRSVERNLLFEKRYIEDEAKFNSKRGRDGDNEGDFELGQEREKSVRQMLDWWGVLNLGRAAFPLVGAGLGAWATLW